MAGTLPNISLRKKRPFVFWLVVAVIFGGVSAAALLVPVRDITWDGGWPAEEYSFTFRDQHGRPVEGVRLRVENEAGTNFYYFPVADYKPEQTPTSDADGVLVFHHSSFTWLSGQMKQVFSWSKFGWVWVEVSRPLPVYVCRFLLNDKEVYRVRYNDLNNTGGQQVKRRWRWPSLDYVENTVFRGEQPGSEQGWNLFDSNGDGHLDVEEMFLARAEIDDYYRALQASQNKKADEEELSFLRVERVVTIERP
jgi:hypothetical protein